MNRRQIAAVLTLRRLGVEPNLRTFDDRLIAQKAIYLAQAAGIDLGYFYNWYLRGPYCPALTDDLFGAISSGFAGDSTPKRWALDEPSGRRLDRLKAVIGTRLRATKPLARRLELLASVHFLITWKQVADEDSEAIAERLQAYGKRFAPEHVKEAIAAIQKFGKNSAT